jgi:hypothetical protein
MTRFFADVRDLRRENLMTHREMASADACAAHLWALMMLDGWSMSEADTVAILKTGQVMQHKNFAYKVAIEPA